MLIHGLQKMTLLDFPGKVACTVFFDGSNFRCPFCHNSELLGVGFPPLMDDEQLRCTMGLAAQTEVSRFYPENIMPQWLDLFESLMMDNHGKDRVFKSNSKQ